jgi:hypothetical protein
MLCIWQDHSREVHCTRNKNHLHHARRVWIDAKRCEEVDKAALERLMAHVLADELLGQPQHVLAPIPRGSTAISGSFA